MRLLIVQFVPPQRDGRPAFRQELGVLASMLAAEDVTARLVAAGGHRPERLHQAIIQHRPQYVLVEIDPLQLTAARLTIGEVATRYHLPVAVCGPYATCRPREAASIRGVEALLLGEYEASVVDLLRAWRSGEDGAGVAGAWVNTGSSLVKGPVRPLLPDLDALPQADREVFETARAVRESGELPMRVGRGCPLWCAYCVNDWYIDLYDGEPADGPAEAGGAPGLGADTTPAEIPPCSPPPVPPAQARIAYARRRSVRNVLDEAGDLVTRYEPRAIYFADHAFALDEGWLAEFADTYPRRCAAPFRCHVRLERLTDRGVGLLATAGCRSVHTHLGCGSRFIREEVLSMHVDEDRIVECCHRLREAGILVTASVLVGCPYESEITVEETLQLVRRAGLDEVRARVFHPTPGTRAAELCAENGWTSGRGEETYRAGRSVLDMPSLPADRIDAVSRRFASLLQRPATSALRDVLGRVRRDRQGGARRLGGGTGE